MPVIFEQQIPSSVGSKLSETLKDSFKKNEKENYENQLTPTVKQVLNAKIEYEEAPNHVNTTLNTLQGKYIVLKPNLSPPPTSQQATNVSASSPSSQISYAKVLKTNDGNERSNNASTSSSSLPSHLQLPKPKRELYDKSKIQVGWNLTQKFGPGSGFNNVGNTCYLNSALQAFLHVPAIAQWLLNDQEHRDKCCKDNSSSCIICCMAQTLINSHRNNSSFTPYLITNRLHLICKHLTPGRQEDAHEFLRYLVEKMERAYLFRFKNEPWFKDLDQYSKETTPLNHLLGGYLRSTVTCLSCHHESVTFQHFQDLPLDISRVNKLSEAIEGYFSRENLEECGYKCESCKRRVSAAKKFTLERAPVVLCVQLKRFSALGGKITKPITITEKLSLQKYLSKFSDQNQYCNYRFVSMVQHHGSSSGGGHYTAVGSAPNGSFYHFDDRSVSQLAHEQALKPSAYILFYELDKPVNKSENGRPQNGHSIIHQNGHTYSKSSVEASSSSLTSPKLSYASAASSSSSRSNSNDMQSFSKPSLPKMIPHNIIKQQNQQKQKENESTPPKNGVKSPGANENEKQRVASLTLKLNNGTKHESNNSATSPRPAVLTAMVKQNPPNLPSMPKISDDEDEKMKESNSSILATPPTTPSKSLVPYDDDDDEEMEPGKESSVTSLQHTASGPFFEIDSKENAKKGPSKAGSTIITKALTDQHVKRGDDTIQQLTKLHHNGYGASNVITWSNEPSKMIHEVSKDQQKEDRKRQHENEDDYEMDRGRVKKLKRSNSPPRSASKLPNPFQEAQNKHNTHYDRPTNNSHHYNSQNGNYNRQNGYWSHNNNNNGHNNHQKKNFNHNNGYNKHHQHRHNNNNNFSNNNRHRNSYNGYNNGIQYGNRQR